MCQIVVKDSRQKCLLLLSILVMSEVSRLATGDQLRTEAPRGYPPHKIFRVGACVRSPDSFYVALQNNLIRLASNGENFPQIRRDFGVSTADDLYPAIIRRQIMRLLPFRGQVQRDWDYVKYLLYVRKALGDTTKVQLRHEAMTGFKVHPKIGKRLDDMRIRIANSGAEKDDITVLARIFEVCVFVYDVTTKSWEDDFVGDLRPETHSQAKDAVCFRRNVFVARETSGYYMELIPTAVFSKRAPVDRAESSALPEYGYWEDRERFLTMLHTVEKQIRLNRLGFFNESDDTTYFDTFRDAKLVKWSDTYSKSLMQKDLFPTKRFYLYIIWRYNQINETEQTNDQPKDDL